MIKILEQLKTNDKKLYLKVEQDLERFGGHSSKGHFNRLKFPDYLDLISFADSYSLQPNEYEMVMNVLSDLNPAENEMMKKIKSVKPEDYKKLLNENLKQNNRTRQRVLKVIEELTEKKPSSFIEALYNFKNTVLG